jgi:hypothetical protein
MRQWEARRTRRAERRALLHLGASLPPDVEIARQLEALRAVEQRIAESLRRDREDYAQVRAWARPLIVLRGLVDRAVLRERARRVDARRREACVRFGATSLERAQGPVADAARAAADASARASATAGPLPFLLREASHFGRTVAKEARGQLVPRVPALVGLAVGWWIAQTFTDSSFSATLHSWGIGSGPRHAVRGETLRAMRFWLPLLAAALCSYAGSRLAALVAARYATDEAPEPSHRHNG